MEREHMAFEAFTTSEPAPSLERPAPRSDFERALFSYHDLKGTDPATLAPAEQAAYPAILEQRRNEVKEFITQAREEGLLDDVDKSLNDIYDMVRYRYKTNPNFVRTVLSYARSSESKSAQFTSYEMVETAVTLEEGYWFTFGDEGGVWQLAQTQFRGIREYYYKEGVRRISQDFARERKIHIPDEELRLEEWEWNIKSKRDKEPKLWDRTEYNTLRFRSEIIRDRADLERAFRQFIRDNLSTGNVTVDFVLGELQPLESQVRREAHRLGLSGEITNRLAAEAGGRLLLFAADWFARIGKRKEVQQLMTKYTDDSTEKTLGLVLSYNGKPLEAGSLLSFSVDSEEGKIGLTPDMPLYKEFKELGILHPEELRFIHYYLPDGPSGELYNNKVKGEKFQELIKKALVNRLATSSIVGKDESEAAKEKRMELAALGLKGKTYKDIDDREFLELYNQPIENIEELNTIINDAMEAYYRLSVMDRAERTDRFRGYSEEQLKAWENARGREQKKIDRYGDKLEVDESKEAATIVMQMFTAFGFSSELFGPRIWKRELITYERDENGTYILDEEDGVYVPAMRRFRLDKNGQIQLDDKTGLPKPEFEYDPNKPRFKRVQGDYKKDRHGNRILINVEDEVRERLGYDANNNYSFFPLDDRSRTVFLSKEYPKPGWMEDYRRHIDPKGFIKYVTNLPEQRDLLIRKIGEDWKKYIRTHRQLMIDYAQDATEYERSDLSGIIPPDFITNWGAEPEHSGVDLSTPEAQNVLRAEYLEFVSSGFGKEIKAGVYKIPGMFAYQPDIIYGGGAPFAIKKDEYLNWWVIGDPIQNAQKTSDRSLTFISLLDTGTRSVARKYMGGPYFRRFVQGLALKAKGDAIVLDDYETQIWVGEFGGADDLRLAAVGRETERGYQTGFLHSFFDKKEELKSEVVVSFYNKAIENEPDWKKMLRADQYKLLEILTDVFGRQFSFALGYLVHNERSSVHEEGKWLAARFMNGVFDLAGSEYGYYAYPDLAHTLYVILNKVKLSQFGNKPVRDVLIDLYVKNYK